MTVIQLINATNKKKINPNAPKRAMSAFMFFSKAVRPMIKEDNPDMSFGDIGKLLGKAFKELRDKEKEKYEIMEEKEKERYQKEMLNYHITNNDVDGQ